MKPTVGRIVHFYTSEKSPVEVYDATPGVDQFHWWTWPPRE